MNQKLTKEEEKYIKLLLQSKAKPQQEKTKKWLDEYVKELLGKYKKSNKLF